MSLTIPSLATLAASVISQIESKLAVTVPNLPRSFEHVLSKAEAGVNATCFRYASWIFLQFFVPYASFEEVTINGKRVRPLVELGRLRGVTDPTAATRAVLVVEVDVTQQTGNLAHQTVLLRTETGVSYRTLTTVALDAATVSVSIRANGDPDGTGGAGTQGNLQIGDELRFAGSPANVASVATVTSNTITAADAETEAEYRTRVLAAWQAPPQGGSYADYRTWALEVEGIIHAYPYTSATPGHVDVYIEASAATAEDADGTPTDAQIAEVEDEINLVAPSNLPTRRSVNDAVNVQSITRTGFDVEIEDLDAVADGDDDGMQTAVTDALTEWFAAREPYIEGLAVLPKKDSISQGEIAGVVVSVVNARGGQVGAITLAEAGATITGTRYLVDGEKAKLATGQPTYP